LPQQVRPAAPTIQRRPPTRRLEPGDLICPECGEGNPETRKFCSRCGTSLETAQVVKRKWWQKLIRRGPKKRKAGDRPSARKTRKSFPSKVLGILFGGVSRVVGVIFIVGGLVYGLVPNVRNSVNEEFSSIKNTVNGWLHKERPQVRPVTTFSTTALRRHRAGLATDAYSNTYWATPATTGRHQPELTVNFGDKVNLKNIAVYNGVGSSEDSYDGFARPAEVHLFYPENGKSDDLTFADIPDKQTYTLHNANGITEIHIFIVTYNGNKGLKNMALARVDFFKD
jgi:hypothetical protein